MSDLISRQAAIDAICKACSMEGDYHKCDGYPETSTWCDELVALRALPSAQPEQHYDEWRTDCKEYDKERHCCPRWNRVIRQTLKDAQPEQRTCVNCGRTVNNGGWYADGRTRCPIEEHYALPKDGYCHLWEKRNVTDDDYPERREDVDNS